MKTVLILFLIPAMCCGQKKDSIKSKWTTATKAEPTSQDFFDKYRGGQLKWVDGEWVEIIPVLVTTAMTAVKVHHYYQCIFKRKQNNKP